MSLETKLIRRLVDDPAAIAKVWDLGLRAEAFEEIHHRFIYDFVIEYWLESGKTAAPTAYVVECEGQRHRVRYELEADVEETVSWLARKLMERTVVNAGQEMVRKAVSTLHADPRGSLRTLREAIDNAAVVGGPEAGPRIWDAADLHPAEQPRWLAKSRLPRAAVTLLLGDEGIGKSLFWALLITHITTGKAFEGFGMPARDPGLVVLVLTEDDWSTDVRPRLEVLGADLNMVKVFCTEEDGSGSPVFPRDIHVVEAMDPKPVLVVVDCWLDTVPPGKKIADPQQARSVLHPWKELATRTDAAVMLLGHTNRIASANARAKYGATYALRQKCRLTLFAQEGQDGELLIGPEKANGAAILSASIFTVDTEQFFDPTPEHDGKVPLLKYEGQSDKTARQHLEDNFAADQDTSSKTTAVVWLVMFLGPGPRWSNDVHHVRKLKGISEKAFKTAKRKLNVESVKTGDDWFMRLPNHADRIPEGPPEFQEVPQEVPDVPYNSEGTSSDLPRSDGTSSDSSQNEGTSCQEVPQEVPPKTKKSPSSCEDNKKSLLTDIEPKGTSWNFLFGEVRK